MESDKKIKQQTLTDIYWKDKWGIDLWIVLHNLIGKEKNVEVPWDHQIKFLVLNLSLTTSVSQACHLTFLTQST